MTSPSKSLEVSGDELRRLVDLAMDYVSSHIDSLPEQPVWNTDKADEVARAVDQSIPQRGRAFEEILDEVFDCYVPVSYNTASPGYLAYVPGGGVPHAAIADLIADCINRYVGVWIAAPALAQIESTVIRWFCDLVGYPQKAGGFLTSGGSLANWTAIVTARRCRLGDEFAKATLYTSNQAHHSVVKAAVLAGLPATNVRQIDVDSEFRVRIDSLERKMKQDRSDGWTPLAIVGHAGTTNSGAIDDLQSLADVAVNQNVWFHVDAAYGGFFLLTERGHEVMKGIERSDSITLDPHKGLFLPYGTGCLLVRDLDQLKEAHQVSADYLPIMQESPDFVDICEISPELSRDFRAFRIWLPLQMLGIDPFRENLDEKLDLAQWAAGELRELNQEIDDELEIVAQPHLSILAFRLLRAGLNETELTTLNENFRQSINSTRRVFLSSTTLRGSYVIRICVLCFRTHIEQMQQCMSEIRRAIGELAEPQSS